jgi:ArsR family transcriptional regulator
MDAVTTDELKLLHATVCQALGDPLRLQIIYTLHAQPRHVTALAEALEVPQPTVSRHLAVLRRRSLVSTRRDGAAVVYSLAEPRLIDVLDTMRQVLRDSLARQSEVLA